MPGKGSVLVIGPSARADQICYVGYAQDLEANVESFVFNAASETCTAKNGCGTHIHSGDACTNTTTQGGHWYDIDDTYSPSSVEEVRVSVDLDPWAILGYSRTTAEGKAWYGTCLETGILARNATGKPFVVHDVHGSRISCGILKLPGNEPVAAPASGGIASLSTSTSGVFSCAAVSFAAAILNSWFL